MKLKDIKHIHFVGIKGVGMTALAVIAKEKGLAVTGSDTKEKFPTDKILKDKKIFYLEHFNEANITKSIDLVVYTGARSDNVEVKKAKQKGILTVPHGKALGIFMQDKKAISVAGSHGKTTTSAMVASVLYEAGLDPSYAIGCGEITHLGTPAHWGRGSWFIAEADEYATDVINDFTPRFLWQNPFVLIITNIDFDHPDVYAELEHIKTAFTTFTKKVADGGVVVINYDDHVSRSVIKNITKTVISFGEDSLSDYCMTDYDGNKGHTTFTVSLQGKKLGDFVLGVAGKHNALNAVSAIAALHSQGIAIESIREGLYKFKGTKRRFEKIAQRNGKVLIDDYAHHPTEIKATLEALKEWYPGKRIISVFQPHTYTRTQALLDEFGVSFGSADVVVITDIYASARELSNFDITSADLVARIKNKKEQVFYLAGENDVIKYIEQSTSKNDVIIVMGAGDIYTWLPNIVKAL